MSDSIYFAECRTAARMSHERARHHNAYHNPAGKVRAAIDSHFAKSGYNR